MIHRLNLRSYIPSAKKTLIEAESQIAMTQLLISDINEALNAPLFGDSSSDSESPHSELEIDHLFDDSQLPETESVYAIFDPSSDFSVVPETAPIAVSPILRDVGETEARGGGRRRTAPAVAMTAEEMESAEMSSAAEEMMRILLPAYFSLVSSFLILLLIAVFTKVRCRVVAAVR